MGKKARNKNKPSKQQQPHVSSGSEGLSKSVTDATTQKDVDAKLSHDIRRLKTDLDDFFKKSKEGLYSTEGFLAIEKQLKTRADDLDRRQAEQQKNDNLVEEQQKKRLEDLAKEKAKLEEERAELLAKVATSAPVAPTPRQPYWTMARVVAEFNRRREMAKEAKEAK